MFRVVLPPIIRRAYNCTFSIWYLSHRYCYLTLSWKSWNRFECAVGGVRQYCLKWQDAKCLNVCSETRLLDEGLLTLKAEFNYTGLRLEFVTQKFAWSSSFLQRTARHTVFFQKLITKTSFQKFSTFKKPVVTKHTIWPHSQSVTYSDLLQELYRKIRHDPLFQLIINSLLISTFVLKLCICISTIKQLINLYPANVENRVSS
jgi:hypothetical protein